MCLYVEIGLYIALVIFSTAVIIHLIEFLLWAKTFVTDSKYEGIRTVKLIESIYEIERREEIAMVPLISLILVPLVTILIWPVELIVAIVAIALLAIRKSYRQSQEVQDK